MADVGHDQALAKKNSIVTKFMAGPIGHGGRELSFCGAWETSISHSSLGQALQVTSPIHASPASTQRSSIYLFHSICDLFITIITSLRSSHYTVA
jgi:hypothetical protein